MLFVPYALPGEEISFKALKIKGNTGYGKIEKVIVPAKGRVQPKCPVFYTCGGCQLQHADYETQREFKREKVKNALRKIGGYLSLAAKFPAFVARVAEVADEFRTIYAAVDNKKPWCRLKAGLLNAWGKKRSWMSHMVAHELWYQQIYSYQGILEAISGLPVDIEFLSFDEVKDGVPQDIDVIINAGDAYTSYSGGKEWLDERLQTAIRRFVYNGGGIIGVGEPTACEGNGRYFQLADVLGVDEEIGYTLSVDKYNITKVPHELTAGLESVDYGEDKKNIYALEKTKVLDIAFSDRFKRNVNAGEVKMAVNEYGSGRSQLTEQVIEYCQQYNDKQPDAQ